MSEAIAKTDSRMVAFQKALTARYKQFTSLLPKDFPEERFARMAINAVQAVPKLLDCSPQSLWMSLNNCAALGLEPNSALHEASIIPRGNKAMLQIEYRAYIKLARNAGDDIQAAPIYAEDALSYAYGTESHFDHRPAPPWNRGAESRPIGYYAFVRHESGAINFVVWSRAEVEAHRDRYSQAYQMAEQRKSRDSPWHTAFDAMAMKTMVHQLARFLDKEVQRLSRVDEATDAGMVVRPQAGEVEILDADAAEQEDETSETLAAAEAAAEPTIDEAQAKLDRRREELKKQRDQEQTTPAPSLPTFRRVGYDVDNAIVIGGERHYITSETLRTNQGKAKSPLVCAWCDQEIAQGEQYYDGRRNAKAHPACVEEQPPADLPQAGPTEYPKEEPEAAPDDDLAEGIAEDVEEVFGPDEGEDFPAMEAPPQDEVDSAPELFPRPREQKLSAGQMSSLLEAARAPGGRGETAFLTRVTILDPSWTALDQVPAVHFQRLMKVAMGMDP